MMEQSTVNSPRVIADHARKGEEGSRLPNIELETSNFSIESDYQLQSMNALEILRETIRVLRFNSSGFVAIAALLICPVSAVFLSNVLVNQSIVHRLSIRLLLVAKSTGLPLNPFIKHSCQRFAETALSFLMCFPLFITLSLLSKAAIVYSVDCTYSRKQFDVYKFYYIVLKMWKRVVSTYLWACGAITACLTSFLVLLVALCSIFNAIGLSSYVIVYAATIAGLVFSVIFANAIIICNTALVISVLEDISGPGALFRSSVLIKGQTQVGLMIFLGSTIGMAFVEGLFEHRVKTLSYGDGSSRIWEGPLLVIMYSFVVLIDSMMSAVFYFSCKSSSMENPQGERLPMLQTLEVPSESNDAQEHK